MSQKISLDHFEKALLTLEDALQQPYSVYIRDASIQRFEYTYEIAWKLIQRVLKLHYDQPVADWSRKQLFKEAAHQHLITDVERWFAFREARNLTSHAYDESYAERVYSETKAFLPYAKKLLQRLQLVIND